MQYHSFTRILVRIVFLFYHFKASFFSLQGKWPFLTVTTVDDWIFHQTYWFPYHPRVWHVVRISVTVGNSIPILCIFTIWMVAGWQRYMRGPPRIRMQNRPPSIINHSSPGCVSREGVFHKCSVIYTPHPKTGPDQGMLNRYFPSR